MVQVNSPLYVIINETLHNELDDRVGYGDIDVLSEKLAKRLRGYAENYHHQIVRQAYDRKQQLDVKGIATRYHAALDYVNYLDVGVKRGLPAPIDFMWLRLYCADVGQLYHLWGEALHGVDGEDEKADDVEEAKEPTGRPETEDHRVDG